MSTDDKGWCVLELMGHRKLAGYLTDDAGLLRIDVYLEDPERLVPHVTDPDRIERSGPAIATQWYGPSAIYCITATTMENCLALTKNHQPAPIGRWELPAPHDDEDEVSDAQLAGHDDDDWDPGY